MLSHYTVHLKLSSAVCQLYINKLGEKKLNVIDLNQIVYIRRTCILKIISLTFGCFVSYLCLHEVQITPQNVAV